MQWLTLVIPALSEAEVGRSLDIRSSKLVCSTRWNPISTKNTKISKVLSWVPIIPATREAEAGESLEPRRRRLQWAMIVPFCSLGDTVRPCLPPQNVQHSIRKTDTHKNGHLQKNCYKWPIIKCKNKWTALKNGKEDTSYCPSNISKYEGKRAHVDTEVRNWNCSLLEDIQ